MVRLAYHGLCGSPRKRRDVLHMDQHRGWEHEPHHECHRYIRPARHGNDADPFRLALQGCVKREFQPAPPWPTLLLQAVGGRHWGVDAFPRLPPLREGRRGGIVRLCRRRDPLSGRQRARRGSCGIRHDCHVERRNDADGGGTRDSLQLDVYRQKRRFRGERGAGQGDTRRVPRRDRVRDASGRLHRSVGCRKGGWQRGAPGHAVRNVHEGP